jgi:hypothetical protein
MMNFIINIIASFDHFFAQELLDHEEWRNFYKVIEKAKLLAKIPDVLLMTILLRSTKWS